MRNFFRSVKFKILVCLLVLMAGFLAYAGANGRWSAAPQELLATALVPFQQLGRMIAVGIEDLRDRTVAIDEVLAENERLKEELNQLRQTVADYDEMKSENEMFREYYRLSDTYSDYDLVSAFVIGRDPMEKYYSFTIDRGSRDGVAVNDVVISPEGAVGRVAAVSYNYAEVLTILDPAVSMGCTISRTREIGLAEGESLLAQDNRLKMSYLPRETLAAASDLVVTTGLGGVFPSGLIVGTVEDVIPESSGKSMYAVVRPAADVRDVTSVFIITNYDPNTVKAAAPAQTADDALEEPAASDGAAVSQQDAAPADSVG
jgi:rod shape-determining protein MreC